MAQIPNYMPGQEERLYNDQMNQALQGSISNNGFVIPNQPTSSIVTLSGMMSNGTIWYDETTHEWKGKKNGVVVTFQTA